MPVSLDRKAFEDCFEHFDRALQSDWGVRIRMKDQSDAYRYRARLNKARQLDRDINRRIHHDNPDHPEYGQSYYSAIVCRIRYDEEMDAWFIYLEKAVVVESLIEELPPPEGAEERVE